MLGTNNTCLTRPVATNGFSSGKMVYKNGLWGRKWRVDRGDLAIMHDRIDDRIIGLLNLSWQTLAVWVCRIWGEEWGCNLRRFGHLSVQVLC